MFRAAKGLNESRPAGDAVDSIESRWRGKSPYRRLRDQPPGETQLRAVFPARSCVATGVTYSYGKGYGVADGPGR
jgi:hypothetical protein